MSSDAAIYLAGLATLTHRVRCYATETAAFAIAPNASTDRLENLHEHAYKSALGHVAKDLFDMVDGLPDEDTFILLLSAQDDS